MDWLFAKLKNMGKLSAKKSTIIGHLENKFLP